MTAFAGHHRLVIGLDRRDQAFERSIRQDHDTGAWF
jgi:hypothetical protein